MGTEESVPAIADWLDELGPGAGTDTLLRFAGSPSNSIDVTHAHPSGLAQFMAGRRTRLSMLLRDQEAFLPALRTARALRGKIQELSDERGIDVGYLAAGLVSWRSVVDGRSEQFSAPVMLVRISLAGRDRDDYDVQISGRAQVNPALVRYFAEHHDVEIDVDALYGAAYMTARFDPRQGMDELRRQLSVMPGAVVEHRLLVSTFADVADPADPKAIDPEHPVVARLLAEHGNDSESPAQPVDEPDVTVLNSDERDPTDELLVLDADASQQEVLDLVEAGESVAVSAPPGTGQTQTALNAAALLAGQGKRVLVVAERRQTATEFVDRLEQLGLGSMALRIAPEMDADTLRQQLTKAILRNERATEPRLEKLHETLKRHRHALLDHVRSLHNERERWGCSPYQAMQELARLTSMLPAPATAVRLKRSVLDSIVTRHETSAKLRRAAEIGAFTQKTAASPWYGARLRNTREAEEAYDLATRLDKELTPLRAKMQAGAEYSQIKLGSTFAQWGEQLELLVAVRESLDKFESDIFDRDVDDLIAATAPSSWRKERGIELGSVTRSRLRRVAKEYIRPGVHIADLHTSLQEVQQQREAWKSYATSQRHPTVPTGLLEINGDYNTTYRRLQELDRVMGHGRGSAGAIVERDIDDVIQHVKGLVDDHEALSTLPERTLLVEQLTESGLSELMDDLREREVPPHEVGHELELAWWQSVLEAMISGDDYLAMSDGNQLRQLEAEYRLADNTHIDSGAARLVWKLAQGWKAALGDHRAGSRELKSLLKDGQPSVEALAGFGAPLVNALVPVWVGSPLMIPSVVPPETRFDVVLLLDSDALSLRSAIGAISRAPQIVAFGDEMLGGPKSFSVSVDPTASLRVPKRPVGTFAALSRVLPRRRLTTVYRGVDEALTEILGDAFYDSSLQRLPVARTLSTAKPALSVEYVHDGTGLPGAGAEAVESTVGEVRLVADLVFSHIRRRPQMSLAVVASNQRHAARIAEAIQVQLPNYPWAAEFFARDSEKFQVSTIERSKSVVRDAVIFALGYGRTPHGKAVHDFGALSGPDGEHLVASALTRSRELLTIVTAVKPEDLDLARVKGGASCLMDVIERAMLPDPEAGQDDAPLEDPLVADLRNRLVDRGATVKQRYRGELDLAIQAPPGDDGSALIPPLAVVSDGTDAYRELTVRQRSRLRPQLLEAMGWRYVPLWTIDVFSDPGRIADALGDYLNLSGSDEDTMTNPASGDQRPSGRRAQKPTLFTDPVLPQKAGEDEAHSWGEGSEDRDSWLKEQRPPHWG